LLLLLLYIGFVIKLRIHRSKAYRCM
jgi:hypothetical protein